MRLFQQDDWGGANFDNFSWAAHLAAWIRDEQGLRAVADGLRASGNHGATVDALDLLLQGDLAAVAGSSRDAVMLYRLMVLAQSPQAPEQVKAIAWQQLWEAKDFLDKASTLDDSWKAHYAWASERIRRFRDDPKTITLPKPQSPPPGQPIGCGWETPLW